MGYQVEYEYRGQIYSTVTRENPGRTLPVRVSVAPVEPASNGYQSLQGVRGYQGGRDQHGYREYDGVNTVNTFNSLSTR